MINCSLFQSEYDIYWITDNVQITLLSKITQKVYNLGLDPSLDRLSSENICKNHAFRFQYFIRYHQNCTFV